MTRSVRLSSLLAASALFACHSSGNGTTSPTITSISLSPATVSLAIGGTQQLSVAAVYSDHSTAVITTASFTSSAPAVATVSDGGLVTAVKAGTATITATAGTQTATAAVTVAAAGPATSIVAFDDNYGTGITFNPFGGSTNPPTIDTAEHEQGTASLKITVPTTGYTGGAFKVTPAVDASNFNAVTFWAKASANITVDKFGVGNDSVDTTYAAEWDAVALTTTWTKYTLPLPSPAKLTALTGAFFYATGTNGGQSFWLDQIQYETVSGLSAPTVALATKSYAKGVNDKFTLDAQPVVFGSVTLISSPAYFTWTVTPSTVASVDSKGAVTCLAAGTAAITAKLGSVSATGSISLTVGNNSPATSAPTPTQDASNVIALYSDAYTAVPVDTFDTTWSNGDNSVAASEITLGGADHVREYQNLNYVGIEFTGAHSVNATAMKYFHVDVWTPDATVFKVKLVDFGADNAFGGGDDTEFEIAYSNPAHGQWISYDIPLSSFTGLTSRAHLSQLIFSGSASTLFVDNIYFYKTATPPPPSALVVFDENFENGAAVAAYAGGDYTHDCTQSSDFAHDGTYSMKCVLGVTKPSGTVINFGAAADLSTYNALTFWAKASSAKTFDQFGIGDDGSSNTQWKAYVAGNFSIGTSWQKYVFPLPDPSKLTAVTPALFFVTAADSNGVIVYFDDVQFESVDSATLGTATAAIATDTKAITVGQTFEVYGQSVSWSGVSITEAVSPSYFAYATSNAGFASVNASTGLVTGTGVGSADITATYAGAAANGDITVNVSAAAGPSAAPPTPTALAANVISLLSHAYTNVTVNTWDAPWSNNNSPPAETDITVGADTVKKYTGVDYFGIEFTGGNEIDASAMNTLHFDIWTDAPGIDFTLVSFGADGNYGGGDDSSGVIANVATSAGVWNSIDLPLANFQGAGLTSLKNLAQIVIAANPQLSLPGGNTIYLDNVYFYAKATTNSGTHVVFDDATQGCSFVGFGGADNGGNGVDTAVSHSGSASYRVTLQGDSYSGASCVGNAVDLSAYDSLTFWAKASANRTFNTVGFGNDAGTGSGTDLAIETHAIALTTSWQKFVIPVPVAAKNTAVHGFFHFAADPDGSNPSIWFDDIQWENSGSAALGTPTPAMATEAVSIKVGATHAVDGLTVIWGTPNVVESTVGPAWFTYSSDHPEFATVANGVITGTGAGTATVTSYLQGVQAGGAMTVNVSAASFAPPTTAPARPTLASNQVISMLSGAYTNVNIDSWRTDWSNAGAETDVTIGGDAMKSYAGVNYFGIQFFNPEIDASSMAALHVDVYSDCTSFGIKPVNFATGAQSEGEVFSPVTANQWNSLDIPMSSFESHGLGADANLGQIVIECAPQGGNNIYIDNVYFHE